jgi:hypothetical protein
MAWPVIYSFSDSIWIPASTRAVPASCTAVTGSQGRDRPDHPGLQGGRGAGALYRDSTEYPVQAMQAALEMQVENRTAPTIAIEKPATSAGRGTEAAGTTVAALLIRRL